MPLAKLEDIVEDAEEDDDTVAKVEELTLWLTLSIDECALGDEEELMP